MTRPVPTIVSKAQVGGRLRLFVEEWRRPETSALVMYIVEGYSIPFRFPPPTVFPSEASMTTFSDDAKNVIVDEGVDSLLQKGAISEVNPT